MMFTTHGSWCLPREQPVLSQHYCCLCVASVSLKRNMNGTELFALICDILRLSLLDAEMCLYLNQNLLLYPAVTISFP